MAGILLIGGGLTRLSALLAPFLGTVGAVPVLRAVPVHKRERECACVDGNSNKTKGCVPLTETLMMIVMGLWRSLRRWSAMIWSWSGHRRLMMRQAVRNRMMVAAGRA